MRTLQTKAIYRDVVIVGGGLAGVCCAITAARQGLKVLLVQDRPVLGGNASSEVRLWVLGATSHMGNNNRWAREGGVIDELLVENVYRNPEGNPVLFDSIILEWVVREKNITLLLNTAVHELDMHDEQTIARVRGFNSQNQTLYELEAPLFVDASGDGIVGFLAGAEFRMGAEAASEFNERMAPAREEMQMLGHSLYFYTRDTGRPVTYIPPSFALTDITRIPRYRDLRVSDSGCKLWWLEYGGELDTVGQTEEIKWELWSVAYGVWNYIKNSGKFPEAENLTLEWMGTIPGKRESRRFVGDLLLTQNHLIDQTTFEDAVSFGGWAIDLHPPAGLFSFEPGCTQWHSKGVYQIPYRSLYSRNIDNLFLSGRLISATHIAFGSTRVMATCAHNGQAVGMAAAVCTSKGLKPRELLDSEPMHELQQKLLAVGQHIPDVRYTGEGDHARSASVTASSALELGGLESSGEMSAAIPYALLLPLEAGRIPRVTLYAKTTKSTRIRAELWTASRLGNTTPDVFHKAILVDVPSSDAAPAIFDFDMEIGTPQHVFVIVPPFADGALLLSRAAIPGLMTLSQKMNAAVSKSAVQTPPPDSGVDTFAFWLPDRRPLARNLACSFDPPLAVFHAELAVNGFRRPWRGANAWVPAIEDPTPKLWFDFGAERAVHEISISFDTDFDHAMESVLMTHPERVMPACVTAFRIVAEDGSVIVEVKDNHQTCWDHKFSAPITMRGLTIEVLSSGNDLTASPPAIFNVSIR